MPGCGSKSPAVEKRLTAQSSTLAYEWYTPFMMCMGLDQVRAVIKNKGADANFRSRLVLQTALVRTDNPDTHATVGTETLTGGGELDTTTQNISSTTGPKFWVRFGIGYVLSAGTTPQGADVSLELAYDACGIPQGAFSFQGFADSTTDRIQPVTGWFPTLHGGKLKMAMIAYGVEGANFQWKPVFQTANTTREVANAWSSVWSPTVSFNAGAGEICTGEIAPSTPPAAMWMRLGALYNVTSGTNGQASFTIVSASRK